MPDKKELSITRYIDAPPAKVWEIMWTRTPEWWAPKPWTTEIKGLELKAGGRMAFVMRGPNGEGESEESPMEGTILEAVPGERLVFTDAFAPGWIPQGPFMVGIFTLAAEGDGTRYTGAARHWTDEAYDQHKAMGFETGWAIVADQLAELAEG